VTRGFSLDLEAFFAHHTAELEIPDPATLTVDPAALAWADREPARSDRAAGGPSASG
jgi:hypothetical protein